MDVHQEGTMDKIQNVIVKKLIISNDFAYTYSKQDRILAISNPETFYAVVKRDMKKEFNVDVEENEVKDVWMKMRRKFVNINLKKSRNEVVSDDLEIFYHELIFLEEHIQHHNNVPVYQTLNRTEIMRQQYDHIMDLEYLQKADIDAFLNYFPDASSIYHVQNEANNGITFSDSETEELDILEDYEDVVAQSVKQKVDSLPKVDNAMPMEKVQLKTIINNDAMPMDKIQLETITNNDGTKESQKKKQVVVDSDTGKKVTIPSTISKSKLFQLNPTIILPYDKVVNIPSHEKKMGKEEINIGSLRSRNDQIEMDLSKKVIQNITMILNMLLQEISDAKRRTHTLRIILNTIKKFSSAKQ